LPKITNTLTLKKKKVERITRKNLLKKVTKKKLTSKSRTSESSEVIDDYRGRECGEGAFGSH